MHNNIMAAGSRDRPPMLATGRYAQWRSRFLRYIDTRPIGDALRSAFSQLKKCRKHREFINKVESLNIQDVRPNFLLGVWSIHLPDERHEFLLTQDSTVSEKDKEMQKNLALIAKYFKKLYKPTNNNLKTFSNTRKKNVDTTLRYKNDNQTGQFGNQRAVNVVGARDTVGGQVV
ncbi:hypothetical protein Tco_1398535 [Tanacetum coccineum]